jgi:hypothetical protein
MALDHAPADPKLWALLSYRQTQAASMAKSAADWSQMSEADRERRLQSLDDVMPGWSTSYRRSMENQSKDLGPESRLRTLQEWARLDPDNAAPHYLMAALYCKLEQPTRMRTCLRSAESHPKMDFYRIALRQDIIHAAESVHYCPFAARNLALGWFHPFAELIPLSKYYKSHPELAHSWIILSQRMAVGTRLVTDETLVGLFSTTKLPKRTLLLLDYIRTFDTADLPEYGWVDYLDEVFNVGETAAIERLFREREGQPGTHKSEEVKTP